MKKLTALFTLLLVSVALSGCYSSKRTMHTLIITGNYAEPRLIAECLQAESNQPIFLLPYDKDDPIWFIPGPRTDKDHKEVQAQDFARVITLINPDRVLILGDERYVPAQYAQMISPLIPVNRITAGTWSAIARDAETAMQLNAAADDYVRLSAQRRSSRVYDPNRSETIRVGNAENVESVHTEPGVVRQPDDINVSETITTEDLPANKL